LTTTKTEYVIITRPEPLKDKEETSLTRTAMEFVTTGKISKEATLIAPEWDTGMGRENVAEKGMDGTTGMVTVIIEDDRLRTDRKTQSER
jgi:hypothetical protein